MTIIRALFAVVIASALTACALDPPGEGPLEWWSALYLKGASEKANASAISVSADLVETPGKFLLRFRIRNNSAEPLRISSSTWLPWGYPNSIDVVAVTERGRVLPAGYMLVRPVFGPPVEIAASEFLEGDYDITYRIRGRQLLAALAEENVIVMWLYRASSDDGKPLGPATGAVVIPRRAS